jgi:hypothetical protein
VADRKWRTEVRRYEGDYKPNATAARFDKAEPAATRAKSTSKPVTGSGVVLFYE